MKNFLTTLLTLLFPPSADQAYLTAHSQTLSIEPFSWQTSTLSVISLLHYSNPYVQALIRAAKFDNDQSAQRILGTHLADFLRKNYPAATYIPIPLSPARQRTRGHNHVASILEAGRVSFLENVLHRQHRPPQTTLSRSERLTNLINSFSCRTPGVLQDKHLVLIDDVGTTGATLTAAYTALKNGQPALVTLLTIAH